MVYQLFTTYRNSGAIGLFPRFAIAITLLLTNILNVSATEYVFTAPPEVDRNLVEIPARNTEYPLYECNAEIVPESTEIVNSHNCACTECDKKLDKSAQDTSRSTSQSKIKQP